MKYCTNDYLLIKFDDIGTKLDTEAKGSYLQAKDSSDLYIVDNPNHSTVISRVLYNSHDANREKWGVMP